MRDNLWESLSLKERWANTMKKFKLTELKRILSLFENRLWIFWVTLFISCGYSAMQQILMGYLNKSLISAVTTKSTALLITSSVLAVILVFGACVLDPYASYVRFKTTRITLIETRKKAVLHMSKLPVEYFDKKHSGDILSRLSNDISVIDSVFRNMRLLIRVTLRGLGSIAVMLYLNVPIAILMILVGIASTLINAAFRKPMRKISDNIQKNQGLATQGFVDIVSGNREIKVMSIGEKILKSFQVYNNKVTEDMMRRDKIFCFSDSINYMVSSFNLIGVICIGAIMTSKGYADLGTVVAMITIQEGATNMFMNWGRFLTQLQTSLSGAARFFELLDTPIEEGYYNDDLKPRNNSIQIENMSFSYMEGINIFNAISLQVKEGSSVALVGSSGGGKSTLLKLLQGFYKHQEGEILVGGVDIRELSLGKLRDMFAYVSQDSYIFDGTVEENIAYGCPGADKKSIERAALMANAHEFICKMVDGYETRVGERGIKLSGGQRQRIAIARAILKNAPILLLDEATSSLDSESEKLVQDALEKLMKNRTSLIVAHRLSTIENSDLIYVLEKGNIIEQGNHEELLAKGGRYHQLYNVQFQEEDISA
jgi:ABC-type multidrug transport system fused ATPase/permease subunit